MLPGQFWKINLYEAIGPIAYLSWVLIFKKHKIIWKALKKTKLYIIQDFVQQIPNVSDGGFIGTSKGTDVNWCAKVKESEGISL